MRLYQPCVSMHLLNSFGVAGEELGRQIVRTYLRFCRIPVLPLNDFVLPYDHPAIVQQLRAAEKKHLHLHTTSSSTWGDKLSDTS